MAIEKCILEANIWAFDQLMEAVVQELSDKLGQKGFGLARFGYYITSVLIDFWFLKPMWTLNRL